MRESDLLAHIFARSADLPAAYPHVLVGPGDDCAVVQTPRRDQLLLKIDQLIEGRHFAPETPIDLIARKAVARAVSDIASMAGTPAWGLASAILPPNYKHADQLFDRMAHWAGHFGAPLVGGDIASGDSGCALSLTVTIGGTPHAGRGPVLRLGARPGDELWVTGRIGGSLISGRHLSFEPRLAEGQFLAAALGSDLHAMIDLSDGLGRDGARIAERSGVRVVVESALVPLHPEARSIEAAAADGEDYELLFAVAPGAMGRAIAGASRPPTLMTRIGRVDVGTGCVLMLPDGHAVDARGLGWEH